MLNAACGHRGTPKSRFTKQQSSSPLNISRKPLHLRRHSMYTPGAHGLRKNVVIFSHPALRKEKKNLLTSSLPALLRRPRRPLPFPLFFLLVFFSSWRRGRVVLEHAEQFISESVRHLPELGDPSSLLPTMLCERTDSYAKGSFSCRPWETKVV